MKAESEVEVMTELIQKYSDFDKRAPSNQEVVVSLMFPYKILMNRRFTLADCHSYLLGLPAL